MFDFRLRSTSNESASSDRSSQAPLSPLPDRLSLRSNHSRSSTLDNHIPETATIEEEPSLFRRSTGNFEGLAELGGITFAELIGRGDMRESIILHSGEAEAGQGADSESEQTFEPAETILSLPGGSWGVKGPEAHLLLQELHRARISTAQKRRRRIGYLAGVVSLSILACDLWLLVEVIISIARFGGTGKGVMRWVEFSIFLSSLGFVLVCIAFLRTRRPSTLGMLALVCSTGAAFLHIALALANFVLTLVWKEDLARSSHRWKVDASWTYLGGGSEDETNGDWKGWTIAATVRILLVVLVALIWLSCIRLFNRAIHTQFVISPHALPSSELRALLSQHRATIVPLPASAHPASTHHTHAPDWLPPQFERAHYVQASETSASYSYVSQHMRSASAAADEQETGTSNAVSLWMRAKAWQGVGWLFGVQPFAEEANRGAESSAEAERKGSRRFGDGARLLDVEKGLPSLVSSDDFDRASLDITSSSDHRQHNMTSDPSTLFGRIFSTSSKRFSSGSMAPLLSASSTPPYSATQTHLEDDSAPPPLPPKTDETPNHPSRTGSSGSSGGQVVFVRMSDGKLVRRLSTIASLSEDSGRRSRSDLSGSYNTGESGPDSFTTAQSEQEVLVDEGSCHP